MIKPDNDNILVELKGEYSLIEVTEKQGYLANTKTKGLCVAVSNPKQEKWIGKMVYFKSFEDDTIINEKFALIEAKVVKGYDDAEEVGVSSAE